MHAYFSCIDYSLLFHSFLWHIKSRQYTVFLYTIQIELYRCRREVILSLSETGGEHLQEKEEATVQKSGKCFCCKQ